MSEKLVCHGSGKTNCKRSPCFWENVGGISTPDCPYKWKTNWVPPSEIKEVCGMQSGPAAQDASVPHALNAFAPDCLSGLMSALRTYAEQSQPEMSVTMTFAKGELIINVKKA
jgi:hypothetical protein